MPKFRIYSGLSGRFGGDQYQYTDEFANKELASDQAYQEACDEYDNMAGLHGLRSWEECQEEAEKDFGDITDDNYDALADLTEQIYNEERESWIEYRVEEVLEDDELKEE